MDKTNVSKTVYCIDIETSTVKDNNNIDVSYMYICGVGSADITKINKDNYKDTYNYTYYQTYDSLNSFLVELNTQSKKDNVFTVILIQNSTYEYSFFKRNLKFFSDNLLTTNNTKNKTLWSATNGFKILQIENIIFLDSYVISNKGLKSIGKDIGVDKLDEIKDYNIVFHQSSVLPENELEYNYNDCLIPILYYAKKLQETFNDKMYLKNNKNVLNDAILKMFTQTNSNKLYCRNNDVINTKYKYTTNEDKEKTTSLYEQLVNNFKRDSINNCDLGNQIFIKNDKPVRILKPLKIIDKQHNRLLITSTYISKISEFTNYKKIYIQYPIRYYQCTLCRNVKKIRYNNTNIIRKKTVIKKKLTDKQGIVLYLQDVFQGGFTYANPYWCYKTVNNVKSFDATSMYPFVMLVKYFPHRIDTYSISYNDRLKTLRKYMMKNFQLQFGYSFKEYLRRIENNIMKKSDYMAMIQAYIQNISSYNLKHFVTTIVVKNLDVRVLNKKNMICPLSSAKCRWRKSGENNWYQCVHRKGLIELNNGKLKTIYKDVELEIQIDSINLLLMMLFYKFELVDCTKLVLFTSNRRTDKYILKECVHFAKIKKELKPIVKTLEDKVEKHDTALLTDSDISNTSTQVYDMIKSVTTIDTVQEQLSYVNGIYMNGKQNFNGLYGINVQKMCPESFKIKYDEEKDYMYCDKSTSKYQGNSDRNYIYGMFIPAFARLHLFMFMMYSTLVCNLDFVYCDTDSVKCTGDEKELKKWGVATGESAIKEIKKDSDIDIWLSKDINKYSFNGLLLQNKDYRYVINMQHENKSLEIVENMADLGNLGLFENDGNYEKFATMGAKNYIYYSHGDISCTIAGVSKKDVSSAFTEYMKEYKMTFDDFVNEIYRPNLLLDNNIAKKKYHCYYEDYHFNIDVTDINGSKDKVTGYSGIVLTDIDVEIHRIDEHMTSSLIHFVLSKTLQNPELTYNDITNMIPYPIKMYRNVKTENNADGDNKLYITDNEDDFNNKVMLSPFVENVL